jgi:hypothetical protein
MKAALVELGIGATAFPLYENSSGKELRPVSKFLKKQADDEK